MAKKEKSVDVGDVSVAKEKELSTLQLSKALIKELNKDKDDKVAWNLVTDTDNPTDVKDWISTGSTILNFLIGNRPGCGIPVGKLTEVVGEEASGKSLLVAHIMANTQKRGGMAIYIDTENALNPEFAKRLGLRLEDLVYLQPGTVEEVGENIQKIINLVRAKDVKKLVTIVWDSVAATPPKAELEGDFDPNSRIGLQAKAIAKMMRMLTQTVGKDRITLVFTNQMKVKIGVMFGDPMGTPGGKAIPYHASARIRLTRSVEIKGDDKQTYAIHTRAKLIKNRLGPPLRSCEFDIHFADGINDEDSIRDYLHTVGEIEKKVGWMYLKNIVADSDPDENGEVKPILYEELQFRASQFQEMMKEKTFRDSIMKLLEKHLVVSYSDFKPELDPECLTDAEFVTDAVQNG